MKKEDTASRWRQFKYKLRSKEKKSQGSSEGKQTIYQRHIIDTVWFPCELWEMRPKSMFADTAYCQRCRQRKHNSNVRYSHFNSYDFFLRNCSAIGARKLHISPLKHLWKYFTSHLLLKTHWRLVVLELKMEFCVKLQRLLFLEK